MKPFKFFILLYLYSLSSLVVALTIDNKDNELNSFINDTCDKKIVLLGEDSHHGSGKTMQLKIELVKRLVNECSFSLLLFESPVYEFTNLATAIHSKKSTSNQLAQSIGGMWSNAKTMQSFITFLHKKATNGSLKLAGIDFQFGANQPYSQKELPRYLSSYLSSPQKEECEVELLTYLGWQYSDESPYSEKTKQRILTCVNTIRKSIMQQFKSKPDQKIKTDQFIIDNFYKYLSFQTGDYFNYRDKSMAENVNWHVNQMPSDSKIIIWCATIHAAKNLKFTALNKVPMGTHLHQLYKGEVFSVGFSALSGSYGREKGKVRQIVPSRLENSVLSGSSKLISYLDILALESLGSIEAQPITYGKPAITTWSTVLDALIVLREEKPIEATNYFKIFSLSSVGPRQLIDKDKQSVNTTGK